MNKHKRRVHEGINFPCKLCVKSFGTKDNLSRHIKIVHEGPRYNCEKCDKSFTTEEKLASHICKVYRTYECDMCDRVFKKKEYLFNHKYSFHEGQWFLKLYFKNRGWGVKVPELLVSI